MQFSFFLIAAAPALPQQVRYGTGSWDAATLGNHRAVLRVASKAEAVMTAPEVNGFQPAALFIPNDPIPVPTGKGWLLVLSGD